MTKTQNPAKGEAQAARKAARAADDEDRTKLEATKARWLAGDSTAATEAFALLEQIVPPVASDYEPKQKAICAVSFPKRKGTPCAANGDWVLDGFQTTEDGVSYMSLFRVEAAEKL